MTALVLVDVQNDFFPGGALEVQEGDKILPALNVLMQMPFDLIVATKDWHPPHHISFASTHHKEVGSIVKGQILWPDHCVQGTKGSEFANGWPSEEVDEVFLKGTFKESDSYSTFFDNGHVRSTGLEDYLHQHQIKKLYIAGLSTDYCVKYSVLDALKLGFEVTVVSEGCRGVDLKIGDTLKALEEMRLNGAEIKSVKEIRL